MRGPLSNPRLNQGRSAQHAGLVQQRMLAGYENREKELPEHARRVAGIALPEAYSDAYRTWRDSMTQLGIEPTEIRAVGPVAVGLGNASPLEVGLTLHHTYGVPYLPGSALKGLALRAAHRTDVSEHDRRVIFGDDSDSTPAAGYATFWDAWLVPDQTRPHPLQRDVITVHHGEYYSKHGKVAPTDFDDPNPVSFVSVRPGTRFGLAVSCAESTAVADRARDLTLWGLANLGIGGKTNAGYGRLEGR